MSIIERLIPEQRRARRKEAKIDKLSDQLIDNLMYGTGNIGRRMRDFGEDPHDKEKPLKDELLSRGGYHPLLIRTLRFTEQVLPTENFLREDGTTPHIRHSLRTALLLQDFLLQTNLPPDEVAVRVCVALAHDNEEEPQEMVMKNIKERRHPNDRGGLTQEQTRTIFNETMSDLPPELQPLAGRIYDGMHTFNRHYADNTTKFDEDYIAEIERHRYHAEKVVDRGMDSPHGDMSRIARMVEEALADPTKMATLEAELVQRFKRLEKSINKARKLRPVAAGIPEELRVVEELFEATLRAGDKFPHAVAERLRQETHQ